MTRTCQQEWMIGELQARIACVCNGGAKSMDAMQCLAMGDWTHQRPRRHEQGLAEIPAQKGQQPRSHRDRRWQAPSSTVATTTRWTLHWQHRDSSVAHAEQL